MGLIAAAALGVTWVWEGKQAEKQAAAETRQPEEIDPFSGGYPVPPMPGQRLREPSVSIGAGAGAPQTVTDKEASRG